MEVSNKNELKNVEMKFGIDRTIWSPKLGTKAMMKRSRAGLYHDVGLSSVFGDARIVNYCRQCLMINMLPIES